MKTSLLISAALLGGLTAASAEVKVTMAKLRSISFLPADKAELRPEDKLDIKRRNPFAERKKVVQNKPTEKVETEESKLRAFFDKQKVSGIMKSGDKYSVSLGILNLEAGQIVPPIIPNQTQILRVIRVTDSELEIGWVEDATLGLEPAVPRKIQKRINLRPEVKARIAGAEGKGDESEMYSIDDRGKVIVPHHNVFPSPSDILESIPPGSDTNPVSALNEHEREALNAAVDTPPAPPGPPEAAASAPEAAPPAEIPAAPPENVEDSVQPDPDLADPAPATQPAGPPPGK